MKKEIKEKLEIILLLFNIFLAIWTCYLTFSDIKIKERLNDIENFDGEIISIDLENKIIQDKIDKIKDSPRFEKDTHLILEGISSHYGSVEIKNISFMKNKAAENNLFDFDNDGIIGDQDFEFEFQYPGPISTSKEEWNREIPLKIKFKFLVDSYHSDVINLGNLTILIEYKDIQTHKSKFYNFTNAIFWSRG